MTGPSRNEVPKLNLVMTIALVAGTMIGSGVFLLPASLAAYGGISVWGWSFTTVGALLLALMLSRLSRQIPKAGGPYAFTKAAFGEFAGFLVGWGYWLALLIGAAAIAVAAVGYLGVFVPLLSSEPAVSGITACMIIWLLVVANIAGIRTAGLVQLVTTIFKGLAYLIGNYLRLPPLEF